MKATLFFFCGLVCGLVVAFVATSLYFEALTNEEFRRLDRDVADANKRCDTSEQAGDYLKAWQSAALACFESASNVLRSEVESARAAAQTRRAPHVSARGSLHLVGHVRTRPERAR